MRLTEKQIIKVLCEIAIHVGLCDSEPTIDNVIKGLRKANCKKCDELASELLALQGEPTKDIPDNVIEKWVISKYPPIILDSCGENFDANEHFRKCLIEELKALQSGEIARWAKENGN